MIERTHLQLSQMGRGRHWIRVVAETGSSFPIHDATGREIAWLVPALEPVTHELLDGLIEDMKWLAEQIEEFARPYVRDRSHRG